MLVDWSVEVMVGNTGVLELVGFGVGEAGMVSVGVGKDIGVSVGKLTVGIGRVGTTVDVGMGTAVDVGAG